MERTGETATEALHRRREGASLGSVRGKGHPPHPVLPLQKEFFENGAAAFQGKTRSNYPAERERIEYLEKKIQTKDEVLAELMAERVALRKAWGALCWMRTWWR
jgi:hypothetical protein